MNVNAIEKLDKLLSPDQLNYYGNDDGNLGKGIKKSISNVSNVFLLNANSEYSINKTNAQNITLVKINTQPDVQRNYSPIACITQSKNETSIQLKNQSNKQISSYRRQPNLTNKNRLNCERSMSKASSESELNIRSKKRFKGTFKRSKTGNELENADASLVDVFHHQHQQHQQQQTHQQGECITIVKISKLKETENDQLKEQDDSNFDLNQLINSREFQNVYNSSSGKLLNRKELKSKLLDNLENLVVNNQQVNEYLDEEYDDKYDLADRLDTLERVAEFEKLNKLNNSIDQVDKYTCSAETARIVRTTKGSKGKVENNKMAYISKQSSNQCYINRENEQLLKELAVLGTKHTGEYRTLTARCSTTLDKKQASSEERLLPENRGGLLNNSKNAVDDLYKTWPCIHSFLRQTEHTTTIINKTATNTTSGATSEKTAGELKTKKRTLVQTEPFLKHLVNENEDKEEEIYECLVLNHLFNSFDVRSSFDQLADLDQLRINFDSFVNCDCVDLFSLVDLDQDNRLDRLEQQDKFVTIIELNFNDKSNQNDFLNRLDQLVSNQKPNCDLYCDGSSSDQIDEFISLDNDKMYAISGVPSGGLNGYTQSTSSTNLLPTLGGNSTINMNTTINTSVVPVVVSSVINPSILNQNVHFVTEQVLLYRQPGQKLGLALNFKNYNEDCPNSDQKIERVFIQNVNPNSPASRAKGEKSLGFLRENDELLCIENRPVNTMSRLDCVECLRDAGNCITLLIKGARVLNSPLTRTTTTFESQQQQQPNPQSHLNTMKPNSKRLPPPIIPPRLSTTVLSSVQKDKSTSDKQIANKSSSTTNGTLTLKKPRRPTVQPPLPPCKAATVSNESNKNSNNEISVSINSDLVRKVNDVDKSCNDAVEQDSKVQSLSNVSNVSTVLSVSNVSNASTDVVLNEPSLLKDKETNCSLADERLINNQTREDVSTISNINHNTIIVEAPKQLEPIANKNLIDDLTASTVNESNNEQQTIDKKLNQQLNQQHACLTSIQQHQPTKPSISYAANISTSSLQLMNDLNNSTNILNCFNSSSSNSNQNYMDLLNQQQQNNFESESDTDQSSLSTVIERFSRTSTANSSFSGHLLTTAINNTNANNYNSNDQNKNCDLQLVNIERMLDSFEFLEQELDRQEPNLNCNGNLLNEKNSMLNSSSKEEQSRKQVAAHKLFDNPITKAPANSLPLEQQINREDMNLLSNLVVNKSTGKNTNQAGHSDKNASKVINYLQRDLTLLTSSNETETPSPVEVNLDDYDDIQTVAANCNVTEYLNSNLSNNSPAQVKSSEFDTIKLPVVLNEELTNLTSTPTASTAVSTTSASSLIKSNRFVKEDSKNKFRLFKPVKISLKDREQEKQNTLKSASDLTTNSTTDLIKKENKEQKDDSQILAGNLDAANERQVKEKLTTSKVAVVKNKLAKEEEKIRTNDQLVDQLIEKGEETKIDSENNSEEKKRKNNYTLDQVENEEQVDGQLNLANLTGTGNSGADNSYFYNDNHTKIKSNEKCAEQINMKLDTKVDARKLDSKLDTKLDDDSVLAADECSKQRTSSTQTNDKETIMMINQTTNLNMKQTADNTLNDKMQTKSTELELIDEQAIRNQSNETAETIGTSIKLENKNESKLDKKSNQSKIKLLTKDKLITNQLNHASKTQAQGKRTLSSVNSNGQNQQTQQAQQNATIAKTTTRPKIIELTKSTTNGLKNNTSSAAKLKRSPSNTQSTSNDQSTNSTNLNNLNNLNHNLNKKTLTTTNKSGAITNSQTSNKNINQIKGKTMTSTLKRIINRTVDTVQANGSTNNSLNTINNKSAQLKSNSIKTNLISKKSGNVANGKNELGSKQSNINNSKELDQVNILKKSTVRKTNLKLVNGSTKDISSASSSAASSVASSSVNLASSNGNSMLNSRSSSQLSITNSNQVKVNRSSSSLTLQRTSSLKQQFNSPSNNQALPRRSKSISVNSLITNDKPSQIPKVKSKEDVRQQKIDNLQSKDVQLLTNNGNKQNSRATEEDKSTAVNMKMDDENNKINNDLTKLIQVTDQISVEEGEILSNGNCNGSNDNVNIKQTNRSEDNQSNLRKSNATSPNVNSSDCNEMTSNGNLKYSKLSASISADLHTTSPFNEKRSETNKVQCTEMDKRSQLQIDAQQLTNIDGIDLSRMIKEEEQQHIELIAKNSNLADNQLNKSEIDYLTKFNSKIGLNEQICEYSNEIETSMERRAASTTPDQLANVEMLNKRHDCTAKASEGGVEMVCEKLNEKASLKTLELNGGGGGGAQHQVTIERTQRAQNISRKEKLSQFKSNDQQVKQQINELIECVKQSELVLNETIDCQPLTIEIFDDLEAVGNLKSKSKLFENHNYDLQCESTRETTAATNSTASDQKTDKFTNVLLLDQQTTTKDQPIMKNVTNSLSNLNTNSVSKFNKIVNNKITNSSKTSDLGGSSSATSSSDESTSKSPNELDVDTNTATRTNLTRKDSVSSSSSSVCSSGSSSFSGGSSSGVSSSHSGQFNQHVNSPIKEQLTTDLLLQITTNATPDSQWIKPTKQQQQTKCSPSFKRIEQKVIGQIDLKNSDKINSEQLINNASVDTTDNQFNKDSLTSLYHHYNNKSDKKITNNYLYSPTEYLNAKKHLKEKDNSSDSEKSEELSIAPGFAVESTDKLFNFSEFKAKDFQLTRLASSNSSTTSPCSPLSLSTYSTSSAHNHHTTNQLLDHSQCTSLVKQRQKQMEQFAAAQNAQYANQTGRLRSLSSRELSINSISSNSTSGDEESSSKQNFKAIVEQWRKRASNTELNNLINSINSTSLTNRTSNKLNKLNKDTWNQTVKNVVYSSESDLNNSCSFASSSVAAVIQNFNQNATNQPPPLPPKPVSHKTISKRPLKGNLSSSMVSNSFMQGASASTTALNTMNQSNHQTNNDRKLINNSSINLNSNLTSDDKTSAFKVPYAPKTTSSTNTNQAKQSKTQQDLDTAQLSKATRSMSVSDICKVFENQQGMASSTNSTNSSISQSNSISQQEKIRINKNLEMRKRELFGKESNTISNSNASTNVENSTEPKTKITKFTSSSMIKNTVESLKTQTKSKSTSNLINNNLTESSNSLNQKENDLAPPKETSDETKEIKKEIITPEKDKNSSKSSSLNESKSDETDSVFLNNSNQLDKSSNRVETIINSSLNSVNRELEIPKLNRNTPKFTAEVLNELIEQASKSIEEELSTQNIKHTIEVIILQRESARTGNIGLCLAGGADYESKEITVHKIINGSLAQRDGRIEKGDRILSINGILLKGKTHKEALEIMKTPTPEVVLIVFHNLSNSSSDSLHSLNKKSSYTNFKLSKELSSTPTTSSSTNLSTSSTTLNQVDNFKIYKANLEKDGAALGFVLEGGKDSPLGDLPLTIKRIFKGGPADKEGTLMPGDEIICVNNIAVYNMTRTEAWNYLKKIPDGEVSMVIRRLRKS